MSSFSLANASAAIAVSSAGLYIGVNDTNFYQWGARFLDDQIQMDLSSAGNTFGNSSSQFAAAWAQAFSNRYLGWSAGAVVMDTVKTRGTTPQLALSIPLGMSYTFAALHFAYALGILALGVACLVLPRWESWRWRRVGAARQFSVQDLRSAQIRLSDASILVHELATMHGMSGSEHSAGSSTHSRDRRDEESYAEFVGAEVDIRQTVSGASSRSLMSERSLASDDVRVSLERSGDGGLRFDFRSF